MKETKNDQYALFIRKAEDFHGHLGPFLVIGVKMGLTGLNQLGVRKNKSLIVTASLPFRVPFSCILDGLQITTKCTVGNRKLQLKDSPHIQAKFEQKDNGHKTVVALNQAIFEKLKSQLLQEAMPDEEVRKLAWEVAAIPEYKLFVLT
jgi:formylmethanofuran dehydrogenase subunit E